MFNSIEELKKGLEGKAVIKGDGIEIIDEAGFRALARKLAETSAMTSDEKLRDAVRWVIAEGGQELGIIIASIHDLYMACGRGEYDGMTAPAINVRGFTFDVAMAVFNACMTENNKVVLFELARSEMEYTFQRPPEYTCSVMAAAIAVGYKGPLFMQGDHFQFRGRLWREDREAEKQNIRDLIKEAIDGGYYNIDIDASTLVDLSKTTLDEQQQLNYELTAEMTNYIRKIQPEGVMVSVGGEIGEVGEKNSTVEELEAYMLGYKSILGPDVPGISKVSVQTGTAHGGVVLPDGTIAEVSLDFDTLQKISTEARDRWGFGGAVQHGASTLPDEMFHKFPHTKTVEVHLATGFQNILLDSKSFPQDIKKLMYEWMDKNLAEKERKPNMTDEQFYYKARKKVWGVFKKEVWGMPENVREALRKELEVKLQFLFEQLGAVDTADLVAEKVKLVRTKWPVRPAEL